MSYVQKQYFKVPTYAVVTDHGDACNTVDVFYFTFYPYNYGKDVCFGIGYGPFCIGKVDIL